MKTLIIGCALLASLGACAQTKVYRQQAYTGDHYAIVKHTAFAGVDVQNHEGKATVERVMSEGKYPNDFQVGDVITSVEAINVTDAKSWEAAMDKLKPEQKVVVRVLRGGKAVEVPVRLRKVPVFGKVV